MVKIDENFMNDWLYRMLSMIEEPEKLKSEILKMSTYVINAPQVKENATNWPRISTK